MKSKIEISRYKLIKIVLLCLFFVLFVFTSNNKAYAANVECDIDDFTYSLTESSSGNSAKLVEYIGQGGDVVIPGTVEYEGKQYVVNQIGEKAFYNCTGVVSVIIPESVVYMGKSTFEGCSSLENVNIPDAITIIYGRMFYGCKNLNEIHLSNNIITIKDYVFYKCQSLTSVVIPNSVVTLEGYAFSYCTNLNSVSLSNKITEIGSYTFYSCDSLSSIVIPNSVTKIGGYAFGHCDNLTTVVFPEQLTTLGNNVFADCVKLAQISLPTSVTSIGEAAFSNTAITEFTIPNNVTSIKNSVFLNCDELLSVEIPSTVTTIGNRVFESSGIQSINIPNSVITIGNSAFNNCDSLETIILPSNLTQIGTNAMKLADNLSEVIYPRGLSIDNVGLNVGGNKTSILSFTLNDDDTISLMVEKIADSATTLNLPRTLEGKDVSSVSCAEGIRKISVSNSPETQMNVACSVDKVREIVLPENWKWEENDQETEVMAGTVTTATAYYDVLEKDIYDNTEVSISISIVHEGETTVKNIQEANCANEGYTGDVWCLTCDTKISDGSRTPTNDNHTYDEGVVTTRATFTETGVKTYTCILCTSDIKTEIIPVLVPPNQSIEITCFDGKVGDLPLLENWKWKQEDQNKEWGKETSFTVTAVYDGDDKEDYTTTESVVTILIEHVGETIVKDVKETSCKETGYTGDTWCLNCNKMIEEGTSIAKTNEHNFGNGTVCTVCEFTKNEQQPVVITPPKQENKVENNIAGNVPESLPENILGNVPKEFDNDLIEEEQEQIEDVFEDDIEENIEETTKENVEEKISEITKEVITESESDLNKTLIFVIVTVPVVCLAGAGGVFFTFKFKK